MQQDLDLVIKQNREQIKYSADLDISNMFADISLGSILFAINTEAAKLKNIDFDNDVLPVVNKPRPQPQDRKIVLILKSINKRLKRNSFYCYKLNPWLKVHLQGWDARTIRAKEMMIYDNEQFVYACYQGILNRLPDETDLQNCVQALRFCKMRKYDLLLQLTQSPEGKRQNIKISGLAKYRFKEILRKLALRLPVLSRVLRQNIRISILEAKVDDLTTMLKKVQQR